MIPPNEHEISGSLPVRWIERLAARKEHAMFADTTPCCSNKFPECENYIPCTANERMIRRILAGDYKEPLTPEQREWLIEEADRSGEGAYPREEGAKLSDIDLAKWTLNAWSDYVKSNCL